MSHEDHEGREEFTKGAEAVAAIVVEVKPVDARSHVHEAQILTHLRLTNCAVGFLMNFNVPLPKQGLRRFVL